MTRNGSKQNLSTPPSTLRYFLLNVIKYNFFKSFFYCRKEQETTKTTATSSSGRSLVGTHRSAFEYGRNMTADSVGFRHTPPRTPEGVRRVNTQIFEGLPKEGAGTTATPPRSPQLDFKSLGLVSIASRFVLHYCML